MKHYKIFFDSVGCPDMWHLKDPLNQDGEVVDMQALPYIAPFIGLPLATVPINLKYPGRALDFTYQISKYFIVRTFVANLIETFGVRLQRFPVTLSPTGEVGYEVVFAYDCVIKGLVDLTRAEEHEFYEKSFENFPLPYGGIASHQKGMLYKVYPLKINSHDAQHLIWFRPWEELGVTIIREDLKEAFEKHGVTGLSYELVS